MISPFRCLFCEKKPTSFSEEAPLFEDEPVGTYFLGENSQVLRWMLRESREYAGKVQLIYIDPPYGTGQRFLVSGDETPARLPSASLKTVIWAMTTPLTVPSSWSS